MCVFQEGMQLISEKPETEAVVKEKLTGLHKMWEVPWIHHTDQGPAALWCKQSRNSSPRAVQIWTNGYGLESQIQSGDYGKDLTSVNILLKKQQASAWRLAHYRLFPRCGPGGLNAPAVSSDICLGVKGFST